MQGAELPITLDLVLIGGGHSHAIALKKFGMNPVPGVKLTLITDVLHTPYSGMLPGYVAGLYSFEECHIDLRPLSQFAQVQMVRDRAIGLDLENNCVLLANRPPIAFDWLSIDVGSTPAVLDIPGAKEYAIPVKPISQFLQYWDRLVVEIAQDPKPICLAIVGGGAGGVELALSIQARLQRIYENTQQPSSHLELHVFHRGDRLLPERSPWVGHRVKQILTERGAIVHLGQSVASIQSSAEQKIISCQSGLMVKCDRVFWVTRASAAPWLQQSGLSTDSEGFIQVNDKLQSLSHPQVFAAGDIATMVNHPRPKAGVFAVRQGKPLVNNLRRSLLHQPLQSFTPQKEFLILLGTGDKRAIASRGSWGWDANSLLWQWKDRIDRQFMQQFTDLKPMMAADNDTKKSQAAPMRCAGCGSKIGSSVLSKVLDRVRQEQPDGGDRPDILIGLAAPDDAAVISIPTGQVMVQTIDYFPALVDDPFLFGQICVNHCLSDIFAMGAMPQSALALATLPFASESKQEERLYQLLSGATQALHQAGAPLIGGHTTEGAELAFGLTCNGVAHFDRLWRKSGMKPDQAIVLTKALGTGTLFAAQMRLKAKGDWIEEAIASMLLSNQAAAQCLRQHGATACTDITGFGLLGHLLEMVQASQVAVELNLQEIPVLTGVQESLQQNIFSSLYPQNLAAARQIHNLDQVITHPLYPLLFDPQTSGGLAATLPIDQVEPCLVALKRSGYCQSRAIGHVVHRTDCRPLNLLF